MNIFLDCGFYSGVALQQYIDKGIVDDTWTVYAFEPNPEVAIDTYPHVQVIRKAVWIKGGKVDFHISGREDSASIKDTTGHTEPREIKVPSINFSKFVEKLPPNAFIICSMDIEGAEYQVLEKMLKDGTAGRINVLDIEFHHRFMNYYTDVESQALIDKLEALGVLINLKVDLR